MSARRPPDALVLEMVRFIRMYVVMTPEQLLVTALWVIHTHCVSVFDQTPYLAVTSPEKQCGKSRLLETLELVVARPWPAITPSEAVVYRQIQAQMPTLLLDEVDAIFHHRSAERYEGLRALLNNGNRRTATVPRCVGTSNEIVEFSTFCAKVLAGIGTLPETVADRSIPIRLERRTREQKVHGFHRREVEPAGKALRAQVEAWCKTNGKRLGTKRPKMPPELSDRMQDGCECLVAIADKLGCGVKARAALVALLTAERLDSREMMQLKLLHDVRVVFGKRKTMSTKMLLAKLWDMDEAPWPKYYGSPLNENDLANLLRPYSVKPMTVRVKLNGGVTKVAKGYKREHLHPAWDRYLGAGDDDTV